MSHVCRQIASVPRRRKSRIALLRPRGTQRCIHQPACGVDTRVCLQFPFLSFLGREDLSAGWGRALGPVSFGERMELLAGLEAHRFAGRDADLGARAGVAANPGFAGAHTENAKPAQLDALTGRQSFFQPLEDRIHRSFSLGAGQPCALDHVMNDVLFNQSGYLAGATGKKCTTPYTVDGTDFAPFMERRTTGRMRKNWLPLYGVVGGMTFW